MDNRPNEQVKLILREAIAAGVIHETQIELIWRAILNSQTPDSAAHGGVLRFLQSFHRGDFGAHEYATVKLAGELIEVLTTPIADASKPGPVEGAAPLGYSAIFNAIAAATRPTHGDVAISVSVAKFHESIGGNVYAAPSAALSSPWADVGDGWQVVPKVPTNEMIKAAESRINELTTYVESGPLKGATIVPERYYHAWVAMLATAPDESGEGGGRG